MGTPGKPPRRDLPDPGRDETRVHDENHDIYIRPGRDSSTGGVNIGRDSVGRDSVGRDIYIDDAPRRVSVLALIGMVATLIGLGLIVVAVVLGIIGQLSAVLPWVLVGAALFLAGIMLFAISRVWNSSIPPTTTRRR